VSLVWVRYFHFPSSLYREANMLKLCLSALTVSEPVPEFWTGR